MNEIVQATTEKTHKMLNLNKHPPQ